MEYYPLIYSTIFTKINNQDDANDLCQEIFIIMYEKFNEIDNYRKWLYGTMRNVLFRHYEKKKKTAVDIDEVFNDVSLTFVNGMRDIRLTIEDVLTEIEMTDEQNLLFEYIAVNNYSYNKTGEILGRTKRQVEYAYQGLVRRILEQLKEKGIENIEDLL